jgi:RNA polymerase sigma-70 factor, ECF subfamily
LIDYEGSWRKLVDQSQEEPLSRLIEKLKAGVAAEESFATLFRRFYRRVYNTFPGSRISAESRRELTQDVFFKVYKHRQSCPADAFEHWLLRIARTTFLSWFERENRLKRRGDEISWDDLGEAQPFSAQDALPVERLIEGERAAALRRAVEELPDRMRQCILLRVYQDMSEPEIAATLRMAEGTVKAHLFAARKRLRETLFVEAPELGTAGGRGSDQ